MTIAIDFDSLTNDAAKWDAVADALVEMTSAVSALQLPASVFSFEGAAASDAYQLRWATVLEAVSVGATQTRGAASVLREIRAEFEENELAASQALDGLWEPIEY